MRRLMLQYQSDGALFERCRDVRDGNAFETLFRRHKDAFYGYLLTLCADAATAEDVSQQCWLRLLEQFDGADTGATTPKSFRSYLFAMGRNLFIDQHVRRHEVSKRSRHDVYDLEADGESHPERDAQTDERNAATWRALTRLPTEQRDVIALWANGFDIDTIARITGSPRNTVLSRKRYAVSKLRGYIAQHGPARPVRLKAT